MPDIQREKPHSMYGEESHKTRKQGKGDAMNPYLSVCFISLFFQLRFTMHPIPPLGVPAPVYMPGVVVMIPYLFVCLVSLFPQLLLHSSQCQLLVFYLTL